MTWTLYQGSCRDPVTGLARLADKSVDVVITDPPYEAEAHTDQRRQKPAGWRKANGPGVELAPLEFPPITEAERDAVAKHIGRITRQRALVFCQVEAVHLWRASLERAGMKYRRCIPWVKPDAMPSLHGRWLALHRSGPRCICGRPTVMRTCPREVDARGHRPALCGRCNRIVGAR